MFYDKFLFQDLSGRLGYAKINKLSYNFYIFKSDKLEKDGIREYIQLWLNNQQIKIITMVNEIILFDDIEYNTIVDESEKVIKINGEVKEYNEDFLEQNGIWNGRDYLEDEIDYEPQHSCICQCKCGDIDDENDCKCGYYDEDWVCKCGFDEDEFNKNKNKNLVTFEHKYKGEGTAITDEYIAKQYGSKYLQKEYIQNKIDDANIKIKFLGKFVSKISRTTNEYDYYNKKYWTQKCRLYKYSNHNNIPYNFVVEKLEKSVVDDNNTNTYIETRTIVLTNDKLYGNIKYSHVFDYYDDGYDYESYINWSKCKDECENLDEVYVPEGNMERLLLKLHEEIHWK